VGTGSHEENALNKKVVETGNPMCLLCNDEKAYQAYMNYLDAMAQQGKAADPDKAMDAVLDQLEAADKASSKLLRDDPASDKTLSPFFCSPADK
jgi:predicted Rossmann-fold nucleotide-binding protein